MWQGASGNGTIWAVLGRARPGSERIGTVDVEGHELKALRKSLGLSLAKAARQVEVSPRTFARWESGAQRIPEGAVKLFKLLNLACPPSQERIK